MDIRIETDVYCLPLTRGGKYYNVQLQQLKHRMRSLTIIDETVDYGSRDVGRRYLALLLTSCDRIGRCAFFHQGSNLQNQFIVAKPVTSDKGEALMKKMGWQPGEGLGKYKQGPAAPCEISMKTDRKGNTPFVDQNVLATVLDIKLFVNVVGLAEQPMQKGFKQTSTLQKAIETTQSTYQLFDFSRIMLRNGGYGLCVFFRQASGIVIERIL